MTRSRNPLRKVERWLVGVVMAAIAFVLEKAVMRSIRRGEAEPSPRPEPPSPTFTSRGGDVDTVE